MAYIYTICLTLFVLGITYRLLQYYASEETPLHVRLNVYLGWIVALMTVAILPLDVRTTLSGNDTIHQLLGPLWTVLYSYTLLVQIIFVPLHQEYVLSGEFFKGKKLGSAVRKNLLMWGILTGLTILLVLFLVIIGKDVQIGTLINVFVSISNTFTLFCVIFLLGFGLVDIPRQLVRRANIAGRKRYARHRIGNQIAKLKKAHYELSVSVLIANHCSSLIRERNPLRPFADKMLENTKTTVPFSPSQEAQKYVASKQYFEEEGYSDDLPELARLRRRIKAARYGFQRLYGELKVWIIKAFHLQELEINMSESNGRVFQAHLLTDKDEAGSVVTMRGVISSFMIKTLPSFWWYWKCIYEPLVMRALAIISIILSLMVIEAEATSVTEGDPDLSVFSFLIHGRHCSDTRSGIVADILVSIPLFYICYATGHSVFKLGMFSFYSLVPGHSDSASLLVNTMLMCRLAPALAYNFLRIISVDSESCIAGKYDKKTAFYDVIGQRMDELPLVGDKFNIYFPIIVVVFCILVATNALDNVCGFFVKSSSYHFVADEDDEDEEEGKLGDQIIMSASSNVQNGQDFMHGLERFFSDGTETALVELYGDAPKQQSLKPETSVNTKSWMRLFKKNSADDGYQRVASGTEAGTKSSSSFSSRDTDRTLLRSLDSPTRGSSNGDSTASSGGGPPRRTFEDMKARLKAAASSKSSKGKPTAYHFMDDKP